MRVDLDRRKTSASSNQGLGDTSMQRFSATIRTALTCIAFAGLTSGCSLAAKDEGQPATSQTSAALSTPANDSVLVTHGPSADVTLFNDAVFGEFWQNDTIAHDVGSAGCVAHVRDQSVVQASAGTMTVT